MTHPWNQGIAALRRAAHARLTGDPDRAEHELERGARLLREVGDVANIVVAHLLRLGLQTARGADAEAAITAAEALTLTERHGLGGWHCMLSNDLAEILARRGDTSGAAARFVEARDLADELALAHEHDRARDGLERLAARRDGAPPA